ncbi:oligosaccharide flippase family protein [Halorubrum ezzemoulense]|uniref:oligosaccharide flippase family protein n=1 Tax=Halorubrum ezzemoulense TaxID=337243 RepID=UPI00232C99F6|nr:oligosaccharide flippase family protein [Halorubrum ezzemoulense]MDB2283300.1 oligosaccharide flippase family protein [Halorubrum ezzemoulense]
MSEDSTGETTEDIAFGGGVTLVGTSFGKAAKFGLNVVLGQVLGPSYYGAYTVLYGVVSLLTDVSLFGMRDGLVRFLPKYDTGENTRDSEVLVLSLGVTLGLSSATALLLYFSAPDVAALLLDDLQVVREVRVFALAIPLYAIVLWGAAVAKGAEFTGYYTLVQHIIFPGLQLVLISVLLTVGFELWGAVYGFLLACFGGVLSVSYIVVKCTPEFQFPERFHVTKPLLSYSAVMLLVGLSAILLSQTDKLMLAFFTDESGIVGVYTAASLLAAQLSIVLASLNAAFAPRISSLYTRDRTRDLSEYYRTVTRWAITITIPPFILLVTFPEDFLVIFGDEFASGQLPLVILSAGYMTNIATGPAGTFLRMTDGHRVEFAIVAFTVASNLLLNAVLIPKYGAVGAAIATGVSIGGSNVVRTGIIRGRFEFTPYSRPVFKPLLAGGIVGILGLWIQRFYEVQGPLAASSVALPLCLVYGGIVVVLGLEPNDKEVLKSLYRRLIDG